MQQVLRRVSSARQRRDRATSDLITAIQDARQQDLTLREIADVAGMTHETVRRYGGMSVAVHAAHRARATDRVKRDEEIKAARKSGLSLQEIGEKHHITRERVRQIVA